MPTETFKVLHVMARFNIGGTARYLTELLPELETRGINSALAVGRVQIGEVEDSNLCNLQFVRIESLGRKVRLIPDALAYFKLRHIIKQNRPDLIHTHTFKAGLLGRLMYFRIPKVHTFHGHLLTDPEFSRFQIKLIVTIEKLLALLTKKIVTTGSQVALDLEKIGISSRHKFISIPGEGRISGALSRRNARENLNLTDEFTVIWASRVVAVKNPKLLVEVARRMPDCKFLMAGDGIELDSIRLMAPSNLKILGFVNIREIMLAGDLFLSTSLNEGVPYSIMEAQSVGLPIVAVKCGALMEIITDGINGYLVPPNVENIVDKVRELNNNQELRLSISKATNISAQIRNSGLSVCDKHIQLYKNILQD
jgi:glycosyltransferase involved in cell wall biosynthesis